MTEETRALRPEEQDAALDLWSSVFEVNREYFQRYFDSDPWHQEGDTLGTWVDGVLVSAVHFCRRPVSWPGRSLWMGGVANVATLPAFRERGLSRKLLQLLIDRMKAAGIHYSLLGTGIHKHYQALGWEQVRLPRPTVTLERVPQCAPLLRDSPRPDATLAALYARCPPRPLLLARPEAYFRRWVGWNWARWNADVLTMPGQGYAVVQVPENDQRPVRVSEWRADGPEVEHELLWGAACWAWSMGRRKLVYESHPQYHQDRAWENLGSVEQTTDSHSMIRNICLSEAEYGRIRQSYSAGHAAWWPADGF